MQNIQADTNNLGDVFPNIEHVSVLLCSVQWGVLCLGEAKNV